MDNAPASPRRNRRRRQYRPELRPLEERQLLTISLGTPTPPLHPFANMATGSTNLVPFTFDSGVLADYAATIDWGDGTTSAGTVGAGPGGGGEVSGNHTYQQAGTFTVLVSVSGDGDTKAVSALTTVASSLVVDNATPGYSELGTWTVVNGSGGYGGRIDTVAPAPSGAAASATATWEADGLSPGSYDVQVTWQAGANNATNAPYQIYDGGTLLGSVTVNQQVAPVGAQSGGVAFQSVGMFSIASGTLRVVLGNNASSTVVADAVRLAEPAVTAASPALVDDGQGSPGYTTSGSWTAANVSTSFDYGGTMQYAKATGASATATATWQVPGLAAGNYDVQVSWSTNANRATNAPYQIYDGNTLLATVLVNQQLQPVGSAAGGVSFQTLGTFPISSGTLRVVLGNNANGFVIADAVRVAVPTTAPLILDNGTSASALAGSWASSSGYGGYNNAIAYAAAGTGSSTATWQTPGLALGSYDVEVSWLAGSNRATDAPYQIYDGTNLLATVRVNQQAAPLGQTFGGTAFQSLGTYTITSGTLRVVLSNNTSTGYVIADAVRVAPPTPAPLVVDNGTSSYGQAGSWASASGYGGYNNAIAYAAAGTGSSTATWQTPGLAPGSYDVQVAWLAGSNRATNAPYQIYDGNTLLETFLVNQQAAPVGASSGGTTFQDLGSFPITSGVLKVVLSNKANGYVIADAVQVLSSPVTPASETISGYVYNDANGDGLFDDSESPLSGATVQLVDGSGHVVTTATTGSDGLYQIPANNPAPTTLTQTVAFPSIYTSLGQSAVVPQFDPSLGTLTQVDIINDGSITTDFQASNSSNTGTATITGTVQNGTVTVSGPSVTNAVAVPTITDTFTPTGPFNKDFGPVTQSANQGMSLTAAGDLAAYIGTGSVTFTEKGSAGASASGAPGGTTYGFSTTGSSTLKVVYHYVPSHPIAPGNYSLVLAADPSGYVNGLNSSGGTVLPNTAGTHTIPITLGNASLPHNDFGEVHTGTISGYVFADSNNDGLFQPGETPLGSTAVQLVNSSGTVVQSATTDGNGYYQFSTGNPAPKSVTEAVSFPSTYANFNLTGAIPQFDPSLGTLTSIDMINNGSITSDFFAEELSNLAAPGTITGTFGGSLTASGPSVSNAVSVPMITQSFTASAFDGVADDAGTSGKDFGWVTTSASQTVTLSTPFDVAPYIGTGTVTFTEAGTGSANASGPGSVGGGFFTKGSATIQVVYHYIPAGTIPPGNYTIVLPTDPAGYTAGQTSSAGTVIAGSAGTRTIPITFGAADLPDNDFGEIVVTPPSGPVSAAASNQGPELAGKPRTGGSTTS